jgi:hypothetical protein
MEVPLKLFFGNAIEVSTIHERRFEGDAAR